MTTTTELRGLDLFVEVLAHIERHPEQWDQSRWISVRNDGSSIPLPSLPKPRGVWALEDDELKALAGNDCGTTACIAGWAALLGGCQPIWLVDASISQPGRAYVSSSPDLRMPDGRIVQLTSAAALELLGLVTDSVEEYGAALFDGSNTRADIYEIGASLFQIPEPELTERVEARRAELYATEGGASA